MWHVVGRRRAFRVIEIRPPSNREYSHLSISRAME
jgi:hypothetical protein